MSHFLATAMIRSWGVLLLMAACLCVGQKDDLENSRRTLQSRFVIDYVVFYNIKQVCFLGVDKTVFDVRMFSMLAASPPFSYTSMAWGRRLGSPSLNGTTERINQELAVCELRILRLGTPEDQRLFQEFFTGVETSRRWLLISNNAIPLMFKTVYLPINSKLLIAAFSSDGRTATLWEVFQIAKNLKQRFIPVGRWVYNGPETVSGIVLRKADDINPSPSPSTPDSGPVSNFDWTEPTRTAMPSGSNITEAPTLHTNGNISQPELSIITTSPTTESNVASALSSNDQFQLLPLGKSNGEGSEWMFPLISKFSVAKGVDARSKQMRFGLLEAPVDDPYLRRQDLTGIHLRCTTLQFPPMTILTKNSDGTVTVNGILANVLNTLSSIMNFTYTCRTVKDGEFGAFTQGRWTGMVREVMEGEADIVIANMAITQQRSTAVDFLIGTISAGFRIVLKRPSNEDYMWTVYTKQFQGAVWGLTVLLMAVMSVCLYLLSRYSAIEANVPFSEAVITVSGFLFAQGTNLVFRTPAGRILVMTILLLQVVLLAYYTSNLTSALTVGPPLPPYKGLKDIDDEPSITFGFLKGSVNTNQFRDSKTPLYQKVWKKIKDEDLAPSYGAGMERVYREKYALLIWDISYTMNFGHDCRAFMLPESYFPIHTSFALEKKSPYVPIMNKVILDIISSGLMTKWWRELIVSQADCNALETAPIELKTVLTPFLLLGISITLAWGMLLWERRSIRNQRPTGGNFMPLNDPHASGLSSCFGGVCRRHDTQVEK